MRGKRKTIIISEPRSPKTIPPKSDLWDPRKPPGGKLPTAKKPRPESPALTD